MLTPDLKVTKLTFQLLTVDMYKLVNTQPHSEGAHLMGTHKISFPFIHPDIWGCHQEALQGSF